MQRPLSPLCYLLLAKALCQYEHLHAVSSAGVTRVGQFQMLQFGQSAKALKWGPKVVDAIPMAAPTRVLRVLIFKRFLRDSVWAQVKNNPFHLMR